MICIESLFSAHTVISVTDVIRLYKVRMKSFRIIANKFRQNQEFLAREWEAASSSGMAKYVEDLACIIIHCFGLCLDHRDLRYDKKTRNLPRHCGASQKIGS